jgi:mono/diheme cytochrome c family protein
MSPNRKPKLSLIAAACALALAATCAAGAPDVRAQMMGDDSGQMMGGMIGGGQMASMRTLMSWMQGTEINAAPTVPEPEFNAELRALGKLLYGQHCEICHGANGDGEGRRATELSPRPVIS